MSLSKPQETVKYRQAQSAAVHGVTKNQTWLNSWTTMYTYVCISIIGQRLEEWIWHWKCAIYPEITCVERWFHCNPSWLNLSNLWFSSAMWMFYSFSLGSVSICMQSSGGPNQTDGVYSWAKFLTLGISYWPTVFPYEFCIQVFIEFLSLSWGLSCS